MEKKPKTPRPAPAPAPPATPGGAAAVAAADGFAAPTVYADAKNGGSGNLDWNDSDT